MSALRPARPFGRTETSNSSQSAPASTSPSRASTVEVTQKVSVQTRAARTDLLTPEENWGWQELRDYVVSQIQAKHGVFPRDSRKEYGIFNRFSKEYGANAIRIARHAFEVCDGWWANAPISVNRFAKGSDPYFAQPILERLESV